MGLERAPIPPSQSVKELLSDSRLFCVDGCVRSLVLLQRATLTCGITNDRKVGAVGIDTPGRVIRIHCPGFATHDVDVSDSSMDKLGLNLTAKLRRRTLDVVSSWRTFARTGAHCSLIPARHTTMIPARHTTIKLADPKRKSVPSSRAALTDVSDQVHETTAQDRSGPRS